VIVMDWLDFYLRHEGPNLIYSLTRMGEGSEAPGRISLVGTSRAPDVHPLLDRTSRSTFLHNRITMSRYDTEGLRRILLKRAELALQPDAAGKGAVDAIAENAPYQNGAGFALEWLRQAALRAESEGAGQVRPRHVLGAKARVHVEFPPDLLGALGDHELLVLLALSRALTSRGALRERATPVREKYGEICREEGSNPGAARGL